MLDDVRDMNDYLKTYGRTLVNGIKDGAEPLFSPGDGWDDRLYRLRKKPYQAQVVARYLVEVGSVGVS